MTSEEIKQNAEEYADAFCSRDDQTGMWQECCNIFIAGAHSRDEEIKELNARILNLMCERDSIKSESAYLIDKLRNPWISVEDRLPKQYEDILWIRSSGEVKLGSYQIVNNTGMFVSTECVDNVDMKGATHWMPIPEKKGGEE